MARSETLEKTFMMLVESIFACDDEIVRVVLSLVLGVRAKMVRAKLIVQYISKFFNTLYMIYVYDIY